MAKLLGIVGEEMTETVDCSSDEMEEISGTMPTITKPNVSAQYSKALILAADWMQNLVIDKWDGQEGSMIVSYRNL